MSTSVRFYRGPSVRAEAEISASETSAWRTFTKASFDDNDRLTKAEVYDAGALTDVSYYQGDEASIVPFHLRNHRGVRFALWSILAEHAGYVWKYVRSYDGDGTSLGFTKILSLPGGRGVMQIDTDTSHRPAGTTKYYWDGAGQLQYVFEYEEDGTLAVVSDTLHGEHAVWADIREDLDDAAFYEIAEALPRALAGAGVAPDPPSTR